MVTLGEVPNLATLRGATMVNPKCGNLWASRLPENVAVMHLKMMADIDAHNKPQLQSRCFFM